MQAIPLGILEIWREACRGPEIADSAERVLSLIAAELPIDGLVVRQLQVERRAIETVAAAGSGPEHFVIRDFAECSPAEWDRLVAWCLHGEILTGSAATLSARLAKLLPDGGPSEVLVAPLHPEQGSLAALILLRAAKPFADAEKPLAGLLQAPFAVALDNDHRWRELVALREHAEIENRSLLSKLGKTDTSESIVGAATGLREVLERIALVAKADVPVLIMGETGSGKEVLARAIHRQSNRALAPFVRVNCGAIPPELVDSELFGHEKGSFTGASAVRKGWFERADGGTLFLDECGELTPAVQVRLLRVLQDGTYERVGGEQALHANVRVVAATHRDLKAMVGRGQFREDLWYRLAVFPIVLPPLRERQQDIPAMAAHFAARAAARFGLRPSVPAAHDVTLLVEYPWPGNVRELAAVIERAALLGNGQFLDIKTALGKPPETPPAAAAAQGDAGTLLPTLDEAMRMHIQRALALSRGRVEGPRGAAARLKINPYTLRARMRKLGIDWSAFREPG